MQLARKFRIPALFCALAVLVCELVSRPYANMGVCDDGPYILMARTLATTGHIVYNGWAAPMLGWQLYLGAAFVKMFGLSLTAVRMSTLLVAMVLAFVLQRTLVRASITERNATIGTLALVLSPLYLMLSVTFMTDITGLFGIVVCLYGCLRALQASNPRATIAWLWFAVATNAICGSSRQIAWLGILVMVPSTLWLLRAQRRVLFAGAVANFTGAIFIFACLQWLKHQPYVIPEHLLPRTFPVAHTLVQLFFTVMDLPLLLLPIAALFLPQIRTSRPWVTAIVGLLLLGYLFVGTYPSHLRGDFPLEPGPSEVGEWVNVVGIFANPILKGTPPIFLGRSLQVVLTLVSIGGLYGLITSLLRLRQPVAPMPPSAALSWTQLGILLAPFSVAYALLLLPRAATAGLRDRYLLPLLAVALLCLLRYYQDRMHSQLSLASVMLVGMMAIYAITVTHDMFAFYRARASLADELRVGGVPDTSVDNGWEYNLDVELRHSDHINESHIVLPARGYVPTPPLPPDNCPMNHFDDAPHIRPLYGVSFDPNACYGPAPFAPVHYSRWPYATPGTLYIVRYLPPAKP